MMSELFVTQLKYYCYVLVLCGGYNDFQDPLFHIEKPFSGEGLLFFALGELMLFLGICSQRNNDFALLPVEHPAGEADLLQSGANLLPFVSDA
ncbi:hypothetical protein COLU111180_11135 [Cohnella lubricantis]